MLWVQIWWSGFKVPLLLPCKPVHQIRPFQRSPKRSLKYLQDFLIYGIKVTPSSIQIWIRCHIWLYIAFNHNGWYIWCKNLFKSEGIYIYVSLFIVPVCKSYIFFPEATVETPATTYAKLITIVIYAVVWAVIGYYLKFFWSSYGSSETWKFYTQFIISSLSYHSSNNWDRLVVFYLPSECNRLW